MLKKTNDFLENESLEDLNENHLNDTQHYSNADDIDFLFSLFYKNDENLPQDEQVYLCELNGLEDGEEEGVEIELMPNSPDLNSHIQNKKSIQRRKHKERKLRKNIFQVLDDINYDANSTKELLEKIATIDSLINDIDNKQKPNKGIEDEEERLYECTNNVLKIIKLDLINDQNLKTSKKFARIRIEIESSLNKLLMGEHIWKNLQGVNFNLYAILIKIFQNDITHAKVESFFNTSIEHSIFLVKMMVVKFFEKMKSKNEYYDEKFFKLHEFEIISEQFKGDFRHREFYEKFLISLEQIVNTEAISKHYDLVRKFDKYFEVIGNIRNIDKQEVENPYLIEIDKSKIDSQIEKKTKNVKNLVNILLLLVEKEKMKGFNPIKTKSKYLESLALKKHLNKGHFNNLKKLRFSNTNNLEKIYYKSDLNTDLELNEDLSNNHQN